MEDSAISNSCIFFHLPYCLSKLNKPELIQKTTFYITIFKVHTAFINMIIFSLYFNDLGEEIAKRGVKMSKFAKISGSEIH